MKTDPHAALLAALRTRFSQHPQRHRDCDWSDIEARLKAQPEKLTSLQAMEDTGGEPDVIGRDADTGHYLICDCAPESPVGRRSLCYDKAALDARKEAKPVDAAMNMADKMGIELLTEAQYFSLQALGPFDLKTSSWLKTPAEIREKGGAIFGDHRFGRVFIYHNGVQSYYAGRGFRGLLRI